MIPEVKLESGHKMPVLGLGTWQLGGRECRESVKAALDMGYRHIDTAFIYGNHKDVGKAINGYDREELFITSKIWRTDLKEKDVLKACKRALDDIGTEYLDLYLIHWPNDAIPMNETMKAMGKLVDDGLVKSIGISNFGIAETEEAMKYSKAPVCVNQVEFHPHLYQKEMLDYMKSKSVIVTAYSPLAMGRILKDDVIVDIANRCQKSVSQVALRWLIQHGIAVIPKSRNPEHIRQNMDIFDWKLTKNEMKSIDSISIWDRCINPTFPEDVLRGRIGKFFSD